MARLLADEDLPRAVSVRLRALGHDVLTVLGAGLANLGTPDSPILAYASERGLAWHFGHHSTFRLECLGTRRFRVTEVAPDLSIRQRITGYAHDTGGVVSTREPDLSLNQAAVFWRLLADFAHKILTAEDR